ncbi:MAG TPA: DUF4440 domain-containing protein, partial [Pyrinomonadaceae bacterium]|nr:DUF4440 domain-containing protein [Pyrinomonadaceae bacterium]
MFQEGANRDAQIPTPEFNNEKIDGGTATVDIKAPYQPVITMQLVKEDGMWKLAVDKMMKSAGMTVPSSSTSKDQTVVTDSSGVEQEIKSLVREIHDTLLRCDKDRLFSFFADDFIGTSYNGFTTNKEELMKHFQCPPAEAKITRDIEDYKFRRSTDTVVVSYQVTEHVEMSGKKSAAQFLYTDTFTKRDGRWQFISSHATRVLPERKAVKVNTDVYDDYVGRYAADPTTVFVISKDGDKLLGRAPNGEEVELLPENETTFFVEDRDIQVLFERDKTGRVVRMVVRRGGEDLRLERVD